VHTKQSRNATIGQTFGVLRAVSGACMGEENGSISRQSSASHMLGAVAKPPIGERRRLSKPTELSIAPSLNTSTGVLLEELEFYQSYDWCLNPYVTVNEAIAHLAKEVDKLSVVQVGWQIGEITTNIFLLSCGLLNCIDGHLRGAKLRLPKRLWKRSRIHLGPGGGFGVGGSSGFQVSMISFRSLSGNKLFPQSALPSRAAD
jgi:hypothetical protein